MILIIRKAFDIYCDPSLHNICYHNFLASYSHSSLINRSSTTWFSVSSWICLFSITYSCRMPSSTVINSLSTIIILPITLKSLVFTSFWIRLFQSLPKLEITPLCYVTPLGCLPILYLPVTSYPFYMHVIKERIVLAFKHFLKYCCFW